MGATALVAVGTSLGTASAEPVGSLPIEGVSDVLVDPGHQRVLVSDAKTGRLVATNYGSEVVKTRAGLEGIGDLELSADGRTVYAAVPGEHAILALDATTLSETTRYPVGATAYPRTLARVGTTLFFGWDKDPAVTPLGVFGSLDLGTGAIQSNLFTTPGGKTHGAPRLLTAPGRLVVLDASSDTTTGGNAWVYDVSGDTPVMTASTTAAPGPVAEAALTRDGAKMIGVGGACSTFVAPTSNPAQRTTITGELCDGRAVAISPGNGRVAVGHGNQITFVTAAADALNGSIPMHQYTVDRLAWQPGGTRLFAVTHFSSSYYLHTFFEPVTTAITLKAASTSIARNGVVQISGRLAVSGPLGVALPGLSVTRTDAESPAGKALPQVTPYDPNYYSFEFSDYPAAGGTVTYTVRYAGNELAAPATAKISVTVGKLMPVLTLKGGTVVNYGGTATVTARLGTTFSNRTVAIWADPAGPDPARVLRSAKVDASGNLTASVKLTRTTGVVAKFAGDTRTAAVSSPVQMLYTRVAVSLANSRQYKTAPLGGVSTSFYRKTVHPVFTTTMTPYPGRKQRLQFEVLWKGKWTASRTVDVPLTSAGKASYTLTGAHSVGLRYRVRAAYLTGTSGDNVNYTTYGAYRYYTFTN
ncbi:hypothetical protein AB0J66_31225 [Actinoplanes sp. NPDC049598]|uniref:hypothetical protein n=1 Tax=Actinoplanes sp. NPDC049598 TaxID=3154626 RepID=UPI003429A9C4